MPLTVLQVLPALDAGGVERGTIEVARELVRRGHRALVVSGGGRMVQELEAAGARHITWAVGKKSPFTLNYIRPLRQLLLNEQIDILHARSRLPAWISYLAWRKLDSTRRPRFVTTVHGPYRVSRYSAIMTRGERVIAISDWIRDYICTNFPTVDRERIRTIPRGVDRTEFPYGYRPSDPWMEQWREEHPAVRQGKTIITIPARITRWKGHEDFLRFIQLLKSDGMAVHGMIAGGAEPSKRHYLEELKKLVSRYDLQSDITFLGHRSDLRDVMAASDLVVSLTRAPEAFGRTTIEALSLGKPVIGYSHGGTAEILEQVFPSGRVPAGDATAAARVASEILRSSALPPPTHPFPLQRMLDATLEVYAELASTRRS